jgi:hypothetical protein
MKLFLFIKEEVSKNIGLFLILFLECFFAFLVIGFMSCYLLDISDTISAINGMDKSPNWYYLDNNTDHIKTHSTVYMADEWAEFYRYITDNYDYIADTGELLSIDDEFTWDTGITNKSIGIVYCTKNFFDYLNPGFSSGYDWDSYTGEFVPIVMGYDYKQFYNIGDVINSRWEVVGFSAEGSYGVPVVGDYHVSNNNAGIITLMKYYDSDYFDYSTTDFCVYAESAAEKDALIEKAIELGLDSVVLSSFTERANFMLKNFIGIFIPYFLVAAGIVLFSVFCTSSGLGNYIVSRRHDYLVHEICGANTVGIALNFAVVTSVVIIVPAAINLVIFGRIDLIVPFVISAAVIEIGAMANPIYTMLKKPLIAQYYESRV